MNRQRTLLLAVAAVLLAVGVGVWLALSEPQTDSFASRPAAGSGLAAKPVTQRDASSDLGPLDAEEDASTAHAAREVVARPGDVDLRDAQWVEGRVLIPDGTPPDEVLEVVARTRGREPSEARSRVSADGSFRVAFAKASRSGSLSIEAEHVFLPKPYNLKPEAPPDEVVLAPALGACLRGVIVPPEGFTGSLASLRSTKVTCTGMVAGETEVVRSATLDSAMRFELRQLPAQSTLDLLWDGELWAPYREASLVLQRGETRELACVGQLGATVVGRAISTTGEPLAGTAIELSAVFLGLRSQVRTRTTNVGGEFEFRGLVAAPQYTLRATRRGYHDAELPLGALVDGQRLADVTITLDGGLTLAGVVKWPDGAPAPGAKVEIECFDTTGRRVVASRQTSKTEADGRFVFTGLEDGLYTVDAEALGAADASSGSADPSSKRSVAAKILWTARRERLALGEAIELVLQRSVSLTGIVLDDVGAPVANFRVTATPQVDDGKFRSPRDSVRARRLAAQDGHFELTGLTPGPWEIVATAKDFASSVPATIDVAGAAHIELRLQRLASLSGVVLDVQGRPIPRASVEVFALGRTSSVSDALWSGVTDSEGRFREASVAAGDLVVRASHPKFVPGEPESLHVSAGEARAGLRLVLDGGASVRVQLSAALSKSGDIWRVRLNPASGAESTDAPRKDVVRPLVADTTPRAERHDFSVGPCVFEHVASGEYVVEAQRTEIFRPGDPPSTGRLVLRAPVSVGRSTVEVVLTEP